MNSSSQVVGAFPPPPGVTPNFTNPVSIAVRVTLSAILAPVFAVPICLLRLYTKKFIIKRVDPEDYTIILGIIFAIVYSILNLYQLNNGAGRHIWDVPLPALRRFLITGVPAATAYALSTLFTKLSLAQFYIRLSPDTNFKIGAYLVTFVNVCYNLFGGFTFLYFCRPIHKLWDYTVPGHCVNIGAGFLSFAALNAATDILLLLLPIWLLWSLHLPVRKKIGVVLVLMAGSFVCAVSIIRLAIIPSGMKDPDITWHYVTNLMWLIIEMYVGIICTCLPSLWTFARHHFPVLFPQADKHGQGLVILSGCNVTLPNIDPILPEPQPKPGLSCGDSIHLDLQATGNSRKTEGNADWACNRPSHQITALHKPNATVLTRLAGNGDRP